MHSYRPCPRLNLEALEARDVPSAGDLDVAFANNGIQILDLNWGADFARDVILQPDGKILVAGVANKYSSPTTSDGAIVRLNADGSLDPTFDGDGIALLDLAVDVDFYSITLQSDGAIVATGHTPQGGLIARFHSDGSLDTSFGAGGVAMTIIQPYEVAVQGDGRIVVGGAIDGPYPSQWSPSPAAARYNSDGTVDQTFGVNGIAVADITSSVAYAMVIQPDGKILLGGYTNQAYEPFVLARFNADGTSDASFGGDGLVTTGTGFQNASGDIRALALDSDGKILATGVAVNNQNQSVLSLLRYLPNGTLDSSFDGDGRVFAQIPSGYNTGGEDVLIQGDGKIIVVGDIGIPGGSNSTISRYNTDGSLDESFTADEGVVVPGFVMIDLASNSGDTSYGVAIQPDGRIVAVGRAGGGTLQDFAIVRYQGDFTNTAPTLDPLEPAVGEFGFRFTAVGHDPDVGDRLTYTLTEAPDGATIHPKTGVFTWIPGEDQIGEFTVTVRVTDLGGLFAEQSATLITLGDDGGSLLFVGTARADSVKFVEEKAGTVTVYRNGIAIGSFTGISRIIAYGLGGNDSLSSSVAMPTVFHGGLGNDSLIGGPMLDRLFGDRGTDRLLGGAGNDRLWGGLGNDWIFGGVGNDRLGGGAGIDRMIDSHGVNQCDWSASEPFRFAFAPTNPQWESLERILSWRLWVYLSSLHLAPPLH